MRMSYIRKIVLAFGGPRKLAVGLGYPESTVRSWVDRGSMTDPQKVEVMRHALHLGIALTPADFFPDQDLVAQHFGGCGPATNSQEDIA